MTCTNGPEWFLPKNQNFTTQVARILWYRPECVGCLSKLLNLKFFNIYFLHFDILDTCPKRLDIFWFWCLRFFLGVQMLTEPQPGLTPTLTLTQVDGGESFCLIATSHVDNLTPSSDFCRYLSWQGQHQMDKLKGKILLENIFQCGNFFLCGLQKFVPLCVTFGEYNCSSASHLKLETFSLSH